MLENVDSGDRFCEEINEGTWRVQTQTNADVQVEYTVSSLDDRIALCTCPDFNKYSISDDEFECKHIILVNCIINREF
jgi:hypothetical protein